MIAKCERRKIKRKMGPILILDKSALQSLSRREVWRLRKHFSLNVPPILIAEILGDLAKADGLHPENSAEMR
jgi:hypothetical protein